MPQIDFRPRSFARRTRGTSGRSCERRAWLRWLCNMFSSFFGPGSGGPHDVVFCVIFPPPQRKHAKEFRDRTFGSTFLMLCKRWTFIKKSELSFGGFVNQGEKSCISAVKTTAFGANKISPTDAGKTICPTRLFSTATKDQSKSRIRAEKATVRRGQPFGGRSFGMTS